MLKYADTAVTFAEIPDCITLCINITRCPCGCVGCHSSYLSQDIGTELSTDALVNLIDGTKGNSGKLGIDTIAFMGGDIDPFEVDRLAQWVKQHYPTLQVAWYSGRQQLSSDIHLRNFDFIKLGPYIEKLGPLQSTKTNQRFYKVERSFWGGMKNGGYVLKDITIKFWTRLV